MQGSFYVLLLLLTNSAVSHSQADTSFAIKKSVAVPS